MFMKLFMNIEEYLMNNIHDILMKLFMSIWGTFKEQYSWNSHETIHETIHEYLMNI